jgi:hypothetical protein
MAIYSIYSGVDPLGIVGTVAPGIFAQEPVLAVRVREPLGPGRELHGAGGLARALPYIAGWKPSGCVRGTPGGSSGQAGCGR